MIGSRGIPAVYGGIERHIEELSWRLVQAGQDVTVYCRDYYTPGGIRYYQGIKIRRLPALKTKHLDNIAHTFLSTIDALLTGADIIHYHGIGPALLTLIPVLRGVKTVVTIHSLDWKRKKWGKIARLFLKAGELCAVLFAHRLIVVSETLKEYLNQRHKRKAFYIPNGISAPLPKEPDMIKAYGLSKDNYILSVGRLVPEKRFEVLIRAFQNIDTDKRLVIVGGSGNTGDYMDYLKKIGGQRVLFAGYQNGEILRELYSNACLFVLPSEVEGLPIALLEAMSYGKTALVSDIPENKEVMGDFGFTFRTNDTDDLAGKLRNLSGRNNLFKENKAQSEYILGKYQWERIAGETGNLYKGLFSREKEHLLKISDINAQKEYFKCAIANLIGSIFYYSGFARLVRFLRVKIIKRGRIIVLMYHRVSKSRNGDAHLCVSPANFEKHLKYLARHFNFISLDEFSNYMEKRAYPQKDSVLLTFDDGWEDNYTNAFALLRKYKAPALIFLATGFIGSKEMLKGNQIKEMAEDRIKSGLSIAFGAHSKTHPRLSCLCTEEARSEILDSKSKVESIVNIPVSSFAYPYGLNDDFNQTSVEILKESGFSCAFTAMNGEDALKCSKFLIPRKGIADFSLPAFASKIEGIFDFWHSLGALLKRNSNGNASN